MRNNLEIAIRNLPFQLPEILNITEHHSKSRNLTTSDWIEALISRKVARKILTDEAFDTMKEDQRKKLFNIVMEICLTHNYGRYIKHLKSTSKPIESPLTYLSVRPLSVQTLITTWQALSSADGIVAEADKKFINTNPPILKEHAKGLVDYLINENNLKLIDHEDGLAHLELDLGAPDELLIEDFKELIKNLRKDLKINASRKKKFTDKDFRRWTKHRVLLYIDLTTLAMYNNCKITQHTMGDILFPDETNIALNDRIRNTVDTLANALLSSKTISELKIQAWSEQHKAV